MRLLHTMIRVGDLQRSVAFYTEVLGMKLLRQREYPDGRFTLAFVGYGDESQHAVIELTHNWDTKSYDLGAGYGFIGSLGQTEGCGNEQGVAGDAAQRSARHLLLGTVGQVPTTIFGQWTIPLTRQHARVLKELIEHS